MDEIPPDKYRVRPEGQEEKFQESLAFEFEETDSVEKHREWSERCLGDMDSGGPQESAVCVCVEGGKGRVAFELRLTAVLTCARWRRSGLMSNAKVLL